MAMDAAGNITDPFGGREDLSRRLLRCVGEPERRFNEDALRMLRTLRFSAQLGFDIDPAALEAIRRLAPLARTLSAERVRDELLKTLASPGPEPARSLVSLGLLDKYLLRDAQEAPAPSLRTLPKYARLAHFCFWLEQCGYIMSTEQLLISLRLDGAAVRLNASAVEVLRSGSRDWKRLLRDHGERAVLAAYPKNPALRAVLRSGECWSLSALAIGGHELQAMGYGGAELGRELDKMLEHVIDHPEDNHIEILCKLAERKVQN